MRPGSLKVVDISKQRHLVGAPVEAMVSLLSFKTGSTIRTQIQQPLSKVQRNSTCVVQAIQWGLYMKNKKPYQQFAHINIFHCLSLDNYWPGIRLSSYATKLWLKLYKSWWYFLQSDIIFQRPKNSCMQRYFQTGIKNKRIWNGSLLTYQGNPRMD